MNATLPPEGKAAPLFARPEAARTAGERIHNEITYRGVDWVANTAFAVGFAYWASRTTHGQAFFTNRVKKGFETLLRPLAKDAQTLSIWAGHGATFSSIILGGTAIIPPIMLLDRYKQPIVEWFDRKIYGDAAVNNDTRFAIRYEAMMQQPKKSFAAGMGARLMVLTPMLWAHMTYNETMNSIMYQPIARVSKWACKQADFEPNVLANRRFHGPQDQTDWQFLHTVFGMDVGLTFIYSYAHEASYQWLNGILHGKSSSPDTSIRTGGSELSLKRLLEPSQKVQGAHG